MFKFFRKHRTVVFVALAFVVIGLPFFGLGTSFLQSSPQDVILKINGEKVLQGQFDRLIDQITRQDPTMTAEKKVQVRGQAMNELIRLTVYDQEAHKYGIRVPDQELRFQLENTPAFQKEGKFDGQTYLQTLHQVGNISPEEFEAMRKKDIAASKLNQLISSSVQISDADLQEAVRNRMAIETDAKLKKEWQEKPEKLRETIRNEELNWVYQDWLGQVNSRLKVNIVSEKFRQSLAMPGQPAPTAQ